MKRLFLPTICLCLWLTPGWAQIKRTAITVDFLGNTMIGANLHRNWGAWRNAQEQEAGFVSASVGLGYLTDRLFTLPHGLTASLGRNGNYFEVGYAGTYFFKFSNPPTPDRPINANVPPCACVISGPQEKTYNPALLMGYRRQAPSGFLFRFYATVNPANNAFTDTFWHVMPGLSTGYAF